MAEMTGFEIKRAAFVPRRFHGATFANYRPVSPEQRSALEAVTDWAAAAILGNGPMLALMGSTGVGKSHLLYAAVLALLERDSLIYARPWYRLADELRWGGKELFRNARLEAQQVREHVWTAPRIALDEVRPTSGTAFDDTELAKLACCAYDSQTAVLLTTNVAPLEAVMGPAAASRFTQIVVIGPDARA